MGSTDEPLIRQQQQQQQQLLVMEIIVQDSETINHNDHTHHISKIHSKKWVFCGGNGPVGVFPGPGYCLPIISTNLEKNG